MNKYDDIIELERPKSRKHLPMPISDRASQFSPFAALTGYDDCIMEAGRITDSFRESDEDARESLDHKLREIILEKGEHPKIRIRWFKKDDKKSGGEYIISTGIIKKIDPINESILLNNGDEISFWQISDIDTDP